MIIVLETINAVSGKGELLGKALQDLVPLSQNEKGCLAYELHQNIENPDQFMVYMNWTDRASFEKHGFSPHIETFVEKFENTLYQSFSETIYKKISKPNS